MKFLRTPFLPNTSGRMLLEDLRPTVAASVVEDRIDTHQDSR